MQVEQLIELAHKNSVDKGFWAEVVRAEVSSDATQYRALINEKLLLVVSECTEAMDELRSGHSVTEVYTGDKGKPEGFIIEVLDAIIRLVDLLGGIDTPENIVELLNQKMNFNSESRGKLHGRSF